VSMLAMRTSPIARLASATFATRSFSTGPSAALPSVKDVKIHEVSPRDGLQNEPQILDTATKLELLRNLVKSSPRSIEVTSFVRPDVIPALTDADALCNQLWQQDWAHEARDNGMEFVGLVLNRRGFERLLKANLDTASVVLSCSDSHSRANSGMSCSDAVKVMSELVKDAHQAGIKVRAYASMAFGCPFEGKIEIERVQEVLCAMKEANADTIILADTTGIGYPEQTEELLDMAFKSVPPERIGLHMHDTHGRAAQNCVVGALRGVTHLDSALGGCGGCPFAPGAAGNLSTHDLINALEGIGVQHGLHRSSLDAAHTHLNDTLGGHLKPIRPPQLETLDYHAAWSASYSAAKASA